MLGNVHMLFFASVYRLYLDLAVSLLLKKHMLLQYHLTFFIYYITPFNRDKVVPKVKLLHISLGFLMGLVYPFFQTCL